MDAHLDSEYNADVTILLHGRVDLHSVARGQIDVRVAIRHWGALAGACAATLQRLKWQTAKIINSLEVKARMSNAA